MRLNQGLLLKVLSPRLISKAVESFDRSTIIVVSAAWLAAVVMMGFATFSLTFASKAKKESEVALAVEPVLPKINYDAIELRVAQNMVTRLQQRYPDLVISLYNGQAIKISSGDGSKFRQWMTALNYIDSISPEYRWTLKEFCVGKCKGELMSSTLEAQRITFAAPEIKK